MKLCCIFVIFCLARMTKWIDAENSEDYYTSNSDDVSLESEIFDEDEKYFLPSISNFTESLSERALRSTKLGNLCAEKRDLKIFCRCFAEINHNYVTNVECMIFSKDLLENDQNWHYFLQHRYLRVLEIIVQSNGLLDYIPRKLFLSLIRLESVSIENANINELPAYVFNKLKSIKTLKLTYNQIKILANNCLSNMPNLTEINLEHNFIYRIEKKSMRKLKALAKLSLGYNNITNLNKGIFSGIGSLKDLDLSYNSISNIFNTSFVGLSELERLKLNHNKLSELADQVFTELWNLVELNLDNNILSKISTRTFAGLNRLQTLSLRNNLLVGLSNGIFLGISVLKYVNLQNNSLKSISKLTFDPVLYNLIENPGEINVSENELICDCKLRWLYDLSNVTYHEKFKASLLKTKCWLKQPKLSDFKEPVSSYYKDLLKSYEPISEDLGNQSLTEEFTKKPIPRNMISMKSKRNIFAIADGNMKKKHGINIFLFDLKSNALICPTDPGIPAELPTSKATNVIFSCFTEESEGLRRVLRGRRTLTRRYFTGLAIPGWVLVLLIAVSELIVGAILYFIMQKVILSKEVEQANTYAPAPTKEV